MSARERPDPGQVVPNGHFDSGFRARRRRCAVVCLLTSVSVLLGSCSDGEPEGEGPDTTANTPTAPPTAPPPTGPTFYRPPTVLPAGTPGELLDRSDDIPLDPSWAGSGQRITYVSTTPAGDLVPVTGVVLVPDAPPPPEGYPVVVWAHGSVGLGDPCAPSRQEPFQAVGGKEFLYAGAIVVAPDYEGLGIEEETHPYLVGVATGNNVLDAARVGAAVGGTDEFVVFGASQGGHATLFARQLANSYLPEMELLGVVAAGPVTDPATFVLAGETDPVIFPFLAETILAWSEVYEEPDLTDLVSVEDAEAVRLAREEWCTESLSPPRPLDEIFFEQPNNLELWRELVTLNTPSADDLDIPVLLTHGDADPLVPISGTRSFHHQLCAAGEAAMLTTDPTWGHAASWIAPVDLIGSWILDRFDDVPPPNNCP
ncbi:MAG TPA: lipase family protein [Microthrixaceae bacterium]|nr:lipase family protein [Microthrixaceae bacterium]